ncbi:MAG: GNAT family N-acetyltransferase [Chlamydiae bacterium]|nr:GNAT family N-acetyltransferase [Chlamydiota bacterium]
MASLIQYGPCTLAENNAAIVIQKFWRGQKTPTYTRISLLALQIRSGKLRKQEEDASLSINVLPIDHLFKKTVKTNLWFKKIVETLREWKDLIDDAQTKISKQNIENLSSAWIIIHRLLSELLFKDLSDSGIKLQVVLDQEKKIQAVVLYTIEKKDNKPIGIHIEYICTAPHNLTGIKPEIRRLLNPKNQPRLKGCGTALIEFIAFECLKRRLQSISLASTTSSVPFYKKMGFENNGLFMTMSSRAAFEFIHSERRGIAKIYSMEKD